MRLDIFVTKNNSYESRTRAVRAIKEGLVSVNGTVCVKPSCEISESDDVECMPDPVPYVGRGAFKLRYALEKYSLNTKGVTAVGLHPDRAAVCVEDHRALRRSAE